MTRAPLLGLSPLGYGLAVVFMGGALHVVARWAFEFGVGLAFWSLLLAAATWR